MALGQILGCSDCIREIRKKIDLISSCDANVLIEGETGTGKELAARAIHYLSSRSGRPFVPINCGAIPDTLFESELFGCIKGAFTDARCSPGLVKDAAHGSLFLDEISAVKPHIQVKLLRLLENKEYKPLGASKPQKADVRIIAATNENLETLMTKKLFRQDLYYRLSVISLYLPPLRDRREDIPMLMNHFVKKYSHKYSKKIIEITPEAMRKSLSHVWPGNIRELESRIQQAIIMMTSCRIEAGDLQISAAKPELRHEDIELFVIAKRRVVNEFEKEYIARLLTLYSGSVVKAAQKAGKSRTCFWNLCKKHMIKPQNYALK